MKIATSLHGSAGPLVLSPRSVSVIVRRGAPAARSSRHRFAGQASVEAIIILVALVGGAIGLGLFGDDGGLAGMFVDSLRRFQRGFGYALSLAG